MNKDLSSALGFDHTEVVKMSDKLNEILGYTKNTAESIQALAKEYANDPTKATLSGYVLGCALSDRRLKRGDSEWDKLK
jgi:hypothetical protein